MRSCSSYISIIRPDVYPAVLRNLIIGALLVNLSVLVVTYAILPSEQILSGANILSLVGQVAGGTWLRKIIVVDSAIVVCRCGAYRGLRSFAFSSSAEGCL